MMASMQNNCIESFLAMVSPTLLLSLSCLYIENILRINENSEKDVNKD